MTDTVPEATRAIELTREVMKTLRAIAPNHELLEFEGIDSEAVDDPRTLKFCERFWISDKPWQEVNLCTVIAVIYPQFYLALQVAINEEWGAI